MANADFIACDWGTSNMRVYLCHFDRADGAQVLATLNGPGVASIANHSTKDHEAVFFDLTADWFRDHGNLPVYISGMAGSTLGWRETPYLPCPVGARDIATERLEFMARERSISIVAGLSTDNPLGSPDVMRGEELQLLGWLSTARDANKPQLVVLPGTHSKWALIRNRKVETFLTALTGELFALLNEHSILTTSIGKHSTNHAAFRDGLNAIGQSDNGELLHTLFSTRSKQLQSGMPAEHAPSYLSGLIIGADVRGAVSLFVDSVPDLTDVTLIGEDELCDSYAAALERTALHVHRCDSTRIALAGYCAIFEHPHGASKL